MKKSLAWISIMFSVFLFAQMMLTSSAIGAEKKVIIGYTSDPGKSDEDDILAKGGKVKYLYEIIPAIAAEIEETKIEQIKKNSKVKYIEPDFVVQADAVPNDPDYGSLWGLSKISAPTAWDTQVGSSNVVIAVIDSGVAYDHPDLAGNIWTNISEVSGNGIDDDKNGYIDDVYGYDFCNNDGDPMDDLSHGTHCAGTIGAVGNNGVGITGVNWSIKIMALKFISSSGSGSTSGAIAAIQYAIKMKQKGASVIATSNSWGGGSYSSSLESAINSANNAGILFIASAGNSAINADATPRYPASYDLPNVLSVAATDDNDNLASFSNYGATSVDLGAPGVSINSTVPGGYGYKSGTSMAAPHVSGIVGLINAQNSSLSHLDIKSRILGSVDQLPSLAGKVLSGGRLNANKALNNNLPVSPPIANFIGSPTSGNAPLAVNFTDQSTGQISSWSWNFGDGTSSNEQNPSHYYVNVGTYTVSLTVTGPGGSNIQNKTNYIAVTQTTVSQIMYVNCINFSSKIINHKLSLYTDIQIFDINNKPLSNTAVKMNLTLNNGSTSKFSGATNASGIVRFTKSKATPGLYTAAVIDISLINHVWDKNTGVLSSSCELRNDSTVLKITQVVTSTTGDISAQESMAEIDAGKEDSRQNESNYMDQSGIMADNQSFDDLIKLMEAWYIQTHYSDIQKSKGNEIINVADMETWIDYGAEGFMNIEKYIDSSKTDFNNIFLGFDKYTKK